MAEKLKELLREYQEGKISRRDFMRQAVIITGSLAAANSLIGGLMPPDSHAAQVAPDDPEVFNSQCSHTRAKPGPCMVISPAR